MVAEKRFKVECLRDEDAWTLFEKQVGRGTLDSHPTIPELAKTVVQECAGLPLALVVVGRAMAFKETPQEWILAIELLRSSAGFSDIEKKVFYRLKLSYNFLPDENIRFCLLYCTLFPEDYEIEKEELIDFWICEGFLDEYDGIRARYEGDSIINTLLRACLLEEVEGGNCVKMHDVIRDMALWISSTTEKEKEKFLVLAGRGLNQAPSITMWEDVTRMSLMKNKIKILSKSPTTCPRLQTLFLGENGLQMIDSDFFQSMPSLRVLDLSKNGFLRVPLGISELVSLQYLNLSHNTRIAELPEELKSLVNLKCLNLEYTEYIRTISRQLISDLKMLRILRMIGCGYEVEQEEDSVLFGGGERLIEELLCLEHLNVLTIHLRSSGALQRVFSSARLLSIIRSLKLKHLNDSKSLSVLSLASLRHLERLWLFHCVDLKEFKIDYPGELKIIQQSHGFHSLQEVDILACNKLRHMTFLIFAPNLKRITISNCETMEEIIKLDEIPTEVLENLIPFPRLQFLELWDLLNLKSISSSAFQFSQLKEMKVTRCPKIQKLPLDCSSGSEGNKFIIKGDGSWWNSLQWDNEATRNAFLPYFKSINWY